jgi:hypothetical protein
VCFAVAAATAAAAVGIVNDDSWRFDPVQTRIMSLMVKPSPRSSWVIATVNFAAPPIDRWSAREPRPPVGRVGFTRRVASPQYMPPSVATGRLHYFATNNERFVGGK